MRILGYCMLATYFASWPLVDNAFLLPTRHSTVVATEPGPDWIGASNLSRIYD